MLAHAVEAEPLDPCHVRAERLVGWRGVDTVRPIALIQHLALVNGAAVEQDLPPRDRYLPQPGVGVHAVYHRIAPHQAQVQVVECRRIRVPQALLAHGQHPAGPALDLYHRCAHRTTIQRRIDVQAQTGGTSSSHLRDEPEPAGRQIRDDAAPLQKRPLRRSTDWLQPHRLPDTGGGGEPVGAVRLGILLAARLLLARPILAAHHQDVLAILSISERGAHIEGEGRVAALVPAQEVAVQPDLRAEIGGANVEQHPPAAPRRWAMERPAVPHHRVDGTVADARERGLVRERHDDAPLRRRLRQPLHPVRAQPHIAVVEHEGPRPVETQPLLPAELRPRVFRSGYVTNGGHRSAQSRSRYARCFSASRRLRPLNCASWAAT